MTSSDLMTLPLLGHHDEPIDENSSTRRSQTQSSNPLWASRHGRGGSENASAGRTPENRGSIRPGSGRALPGRGLMGLLRARGALGPDR